MAAISSRFGQSSPGSTLEQFPSVSVGVRRALLHTFPYAVYFRETEQFVVILAVLHLRRRIVAHRLSAAERQQKPLV